MVFDIPDKDRKIKKLKKQVKQLKKEVLFLDQISARSNANFERRITALEKHTKIGHPKTPNPTR